MHEHHKLPSAIHKYYGFPSLHCYFRCSEVEGFPCVQRKFGGGQMAGWYEALGKHLEKCQVLLNYLFNQWSNQLFILSSPRFVCEQLW